MSDTLPSPASVQQTPAPGDALVLFCGDVFELTLLVPGAGKGKAFIRTNLGTAEKTRKETIKRVERNEIRLEEAWRDIPMRPAGPGTFSARLPLTQTGHFQAKCFFLPDGKTDPVWPPGENTLVNVEPAGTCCANIIYNAFVRQFGANRSGRRKTDRPEEGIEALDQKGWTVIPESGKFRDLTAEADFIFKELGCRALHLLPIHPTPTTYGRMGRFGSPYAALSFTDVDPALAVFDPAATPLEQFLELVDAVHSRSSYLILDIAINHTGWAAAIHESNPQWLDRTDDGRITAPGAWGVVWADLTKLDFSHTDLWEYMAGVFLLWCRRGVDGFRCDAGYMVPVSTWTYIISKVRQEYPDTLFFLEGLGGPLETTKALLGAANFNWAYSELFQQYTKDDIARYLPFSTEISETCGHMIHFAETHDNDRLAKVSHVYAKMRTALCALFSVCGGFGFANGVEWFATEKINVHESPSLNWGSPVNQVDFIKRLILILREHPAFFAGTRLELIQEPDSSALVLLRHHRSSGSRVLVLVNPDCSRTLAARWEKARALGSEDTWIDLITGLETQPRPIGSIDELPLAPGQVLCLAPDPRDLALINDRAGREKHSPDQVLLQKRKALALSIIESTNGYTDLGDLDLDDAAMAAAQDPESFIRSLVPDSKENRVIPFDADRDINRQVMVPPGFFLMVVSKRPFRAELLEDRKHKRCLGYREGMPNPDRSVFRAIFLPREPGAASCLLRLRIFGPDATRIETGRIRFLPPFDSLSLDMTFNRFDIMRSPGLKQLSATCQGGMMRAAADFGQLTSRYDGLLAANLNPDLPEDRWMLLARHRIWAVFQGYSRELSLDCLETFFASHDRGGRWQFQIPTSEGRYYTLTAWLSLDREQNRVTMILHREKAPADASRRLADHQAVTIIVRPDIEDRSFHDTVKAYTGPETRWPHDITPFDAGFVFSSQRDASLRVFCSKGAFFAEPQWQYMVHRSIESGRGLDPDSDLFSPGYFKLHLNGGDTVRIRADAVPPPGQAPEDSETPVRVPPAFDTGLPFAQALEKSLDAFLVNRENKKSVIAGYPWFLDWGRDSLIFCRSLIELGRTREALAILTLFGQYENQGTLPNMIRGSDAGNIETSDAPLWFFACCRQMAERNGAASILDQDMGGRPLYRILKQMARAMIQGTPTGVKADPDTGLLYSPPHYTWMDTNFPAGTPRQGFPIEIQALWHHALDFMTVVDPKGQKSWAGKAKQVRRAIVERFWLEQKGYFSDCLHSAGPDQAGEAKADDALRPNQLLLVTLGAIDDQALMEKTVGACRELLIPGAIRSLADRPVAYPLPIMHDGRPLNDPLSPYAGTYAGDEDTQRKPAYHNGTAWTWPFPSFCEAWVMVFGPLAIPSALAWLGSALPLMRNGAAGFLPEILDGDWPHCPRGCDAQAWGSSEAARVVHKLTRLKKGTL